MRTGFLKVGLIFLSLLHAGSTLAAPRDAITETMRQRCEEGNMMFTNGCMSAAYAHSDAHMNLLYKHLASALADSASLRTAQRKWISFRDAECKFQNEATIGGSIHPYGTNICLTELTERRIADLEAVQPCNGCNLFKDEFYKDATPYRVPKRQPFHYTEKR